jgi:hypothetical protein
MAWFEDTSEEGMLIKFENKIIEIRKLLLGTLMLLRDMWEDDLKQTPDGIELLQTIEKIEEAFLNSSSIDKFEHFDNLLDVTLERAKGIFLLVEYKSKNKEN